MADFPEPMEIPPSNYVNAYSTIMLAPNNLSKQTVGAKYFALDGGEEGLVGYEGHVMWILPIVGEILAHEVYNGG